MSKQKILQHKVTRLAHTLPVIHVHVYEICLKKTRNTQAENIKAILFTVRKRSPIFGSTEKVNLEVTRS
jgi:glyceraldehyde-3-phosphate dehydrogenase/erythrose-4-phosphate dehydrogenase